MKNTLIIINYLNNNILLKKSQNSWELPSLLNKQKDESDVALLIKQVKSKMELTGLVLDCIVCSKDERVYIFETFGCSIKLLNSKWLDLNNITEFNEIDPSHLKLIAKYKNYCSLKNYSSCHNTPIWSQRGWLKYILEFIPAKLQLMYPIRPENLLQVRAWCISTTIKINYSPMSFYFKALNKLVGHEILLTPYLYKNFPNLIPKVLATDKKNICIITQDLKGTGLSACKGFDLWVKAIKSYSKIQVKLIEKTNELKEIFLPQRDINWLKINIDLLLKDENLLKAGRNGGLEDKQICSLKALSNDLKAICSEYERLDLPYSIEHGDLHAKNIIVSKENIFYIDWSHSSISIPFVSFHNFINHSGQKLKKSQIETLQEAYIEEWRSVIDKKIIRKALELSEPLYYLQQAIIHYEFYHSLSNESKWEVAGGVSYFLKSLLKLSNL